MTSRHNRARVGVVLLAAAALALAGCGSSDNPTGGSSSGATATPTESLPGTGWKTAERDAVADGGTLTLPVDMTPLNFQIFNPDAGTVDDQTIESLYLPAFVTVAEDGTWSANPDYATSVELKSEDPQVAEIKINPKAVWSDGTPITYKDVAANWKALSGENKDFAPVATNVWEDVASVEKGENDQDVLITFAKKNADWASVLFPIYPAWAVATPDAFNKSWQKGPYAEDGKTYVSGGPFIVKSYDVNGQVLTFTKNPKWWGDEPKLDTIIFKTVSRDSQAQAFANSEIDAFNLNGQADNLKTAQGRSDATIERSLGTQFRHITLNGTSEVFSDVAVRKAFAVALDRATLGQAILGPVGSPVEELNNLIFLPGQKGYADNASTVLTGKADDAKQILTDAGYTIGSDGKATKDGKAIEVNFVIPSDNTNSSNIAQLAKQEESLAGITVNINTVPSGDFFDKYVNTTDRNFDATYFAWQGTAWPISSTKSIYYPADAGQNYAGVTDDSLGADWDAANAELDNDKRIEMANAIDQKLINLFTTIPLFPEPYAWGVKDTLVNYGPSQFQAYTLRWQDVGYAK